MRLFFIIIFNIFIFNIHCSVAAEQSVEIGTSKDITVHATGMCKRVTNNCTSGNGALFVPNGSDAELHSFINANLGCVTVVDC